LQGKIFIVSIMGSKPSP